MNMNVKFKNPPINEVIIGVYFDPSLAELRNEHIGFLWSRFKDQFPKVEQRAPIGSPINDRNQPNRAVYELRNEFMPRYWFVSEDEVTLIQTQKDAFLLNWRQRDTEYPHFDEILKSKFDEYYRIFKLFLMNDVGISNPIIGHCELTYINIVTPSEFWRRPLDTPKVIQSFSFPECDSTHGTGSAFNCAYYFNVNSSLQLQVAVRSGVSTEQPDSPFLYLEFKGLGSPISPEKTDIDAWFGMTHKTIVQQFLSMTNDKVQRQLWKLVESE